MQNKTETKKTKGAATQLSRMAMKLQFPLFLLKGPSFRKDHKLARDLYVKSEKRKMARYKCEKFYFQLKDVTFKRKYVN